MLQFCKPSQQSNYGITIQGLIIDDKNKATPKSLNSYYKRIKVTLNL